MSGPSARGGGRVRGLGRSRSIRWRAATWSPPSARSITTRAFARSSPSSSQARSRVARFKLPGGRPRGLPDRPGWNRPPASRDAEAAESRGAMTTSEICLSWRQYTSFSYFFKPAGLQLASGARNLIPIQILSKRSISGTYVHVSARRSTTHLTASLLPKHILGHLPYVGEDKARDIG